MNNDNEFGKHPSKELQTIYSQKPYQMQVPEKAKIIFLGLDANLDKNIEDNKLLFNEFIEYFKDGISYWKMHGFHTPILSKNYKGLGLKYHKSFSKLGITSNYAEKICFMELLNICTYGKSSGKKQFLTFLNDTSNKVHLNRIRELANMKKIICISVGVKNYINKLNLFNTDNDNIIIHTHFSNAIKDEELVKLGILLKNYLS